MKALSKLSILPRIPEPIDRLEELAYNMWWSWNPTALELYQRLDGELWENVNHNPVRVLREISQQRLEEVAGEQDYLSLYTDVMDAFDAYMDTTADTWFKRNHNGDMKSIIAYFSAEFGLHEALPIYSGGLGILSGDHCKAASDMDLPFIGVGFLYPQGYFTQEINEEGNQVAKYEKIDLSEVPAVPVKDKNDKDVLISVDLPGRTVYAQVWRVQVGRITIYLLDTDVERNAPQDRELSARLYGGDREIRVSQEIVLGIGGVRALRAMGYEPAVWHMNEGHSAFLGLERVRELVVGRGLSFDEAVESVRSNTLFTTHTPVPAGNDAFEFELIDKFFWQWWGQLGIDRERFMRFARQELDWGPRYSMTVLALQLSGYHNGVSKLHGQVSRGMWQFLWPETPVREVPIGHITNGVHTGTWLAPELKNLYDAYLPNEWMDQVENETIWQGIDRIPDAELWSAHRQRKEKLIELVRNRVRAQLLRHGERSERIREVDNLLDPNAFIIGFARRFATYKRATLLFRDEERIRKILSDPNRPVHLVFAGKSHPDDEPGKALIRRIHELSQDSELRGKIIFVEDYDINLARHLVSGADLWLNTPRRPHEASGTSGQKAALCGVPNFSVLDGWWVEGYNGDNGWVIGEDRRYKDEVTQDYDDASNLYYTLEESILPLFYERDADAIPTGWLQVMKNSIITCGPRFSMQRMVIEYVEDYYMPAAESGIQYRKDGYAVSKSVAHWKRDIHSHWNRVKISGKVEGVQPAFVGDKIKVAATVQLPEGITQPDVIVEAVYGLETDGGELLAPNVAPLEHTGGSGRELSYEQTIQPESSGAMSIGVRVRPRNETLVNQYETGRMVWA